LVEQCFGWMKTFGWLRKLRRHCVNSLFIFTPQRLTSPDAHAARSTTLTR
jgi:hypothetical protein